LDSLGFEFWQGQKCPDWSWGASLGSCTMSSRFIFGKGGGVNWPGCEIDHSPPFSAEAENMCSVAAPLIPLCAFVGTALIICC
jgi:hypothetical protein